MTGGGTMCGRPVEEGRPTRRAVAGEMLAALRAQSTQWTALASHRRADGRWAGAGGTAARTASPSGRQRIGGVSWSRGSDEFLDQLPSTPNMHPTSDELEFGAHIERYRRELQVHCYRMLGSYDDSEDLVQETFLRAWRGRATFQGRASLRTWLYRIATNACLDALDRRPRRVLPP